MNNKAMTGLMTAAAALMGAFSTMVPANAASLKNSDEWNDLTEHPVQDRSTDNSEFQALLPDFQKYVQPEGKQIPENQIKKLDPNNLLLKDDQDVRVWFLSSSAIYHNQIAYEAIQGSNYQKGWIFSDASCKSGNNNECELASDDGKLNVGDYVDLGKVAGGTQINFWLRANGDQPNDPGGTNPETQVKNIYGADATQNPDQLDHVVAYEYKDHLLVGFEDLFGPSGSTAGGNGNSQADRDFNDVVLVVDVGKDNLEQTNVPEPRAAIALLGIGAVGMLKLRRRR